MTRTRFMQTTSLTLAAGLVSLATAANADQQILDDLIVDGSICVGLDCVNGESFGFDTIRLKENNLRIKFQDTSASASFPSRDWQLAANDTTNGGANRFSIEDVDGGRTPFTVEAASPNHSVYIEDGGRVGFGTNTPVVNLHVVEGNSPTLRLEQDGSSGFTAQTWDLAGNEANFFIRDVTNGSKLPIQIKPGAPTASIFIEAAGDTGLGTASPDDALDVERTGSVAMRLTNGTGAWRLNHNGTSGNLNIARNSANTPMKISPTAAENLLLIGTVAIDQVDITGNLDVSGTISVAGSQVHPDYVFAPDYELMPLYEVEKFVIANRHLPKIPSAAEVEANGLNMTKMQLSLLEKVEELTLYTLEQQKTIDLLLQEVDNLKN